MTGYVAAAAYYILLHRGSGRKAPGAFAAGQINEITCIGILFLIVLMAVYVFSFPKYRSEQVMLTYFGMFYVAVMLSYIYQDKTACTRGISRRTCGLSVPGDVIRVRTVSEC